MKLKINEKEYEVLSSIKFGIIRRTMENPNDIKNQLDFIQNVLKPSPSIEEIDEMMDDEIVMIMRSYFDLQDKKTVDFKKKRS